MKKKEPLPETLEGKTPEEQRLLKIKTANLPLPSTWKLSKAGLESIRLFLGQQRTKHGLYAQIPMVCKGSDCPYAQTCVAVEYGEPPVGERCTREISIIMDRLDRYCEEMGIEDTGLVSLSLIKELVDAEIMIERCNSILSSGDAELIEDVVAGVSNKGQEFTRPEIHKAVEMKERWINVRHKALNQLNSTPKDKAKTEANKSMDGSVYASKLMKLAQEKFGDNNEIIDIEPHDEESDKE